MEEEEEEDHIHQRGLCYRKLNLNVPLLSIRRSLSAATNYYDKSEERFTSTTPLNTVPFSWERIPGEPKDREINSSTHKHPPPPPTPPPRWRLLQEAVRKEENSSENLYVDRFSDFDFGFDGDVDDYESDYHHGREGYDGGGFPSDAIDIFSLAESVADEEIEIGGGTPEQEAKVYKSPNFIMKRFLPDARTLAAASAGDWTKLHASPCSNSTRTINGLPRGVSGRSSVRGCGIGSLFRWRFKPKMCSSKSQARETAVRIVHARSLQQ